VCVPTIFNKHSNSDHLCLLCATVHCEEVPIVPPKSGLLNAETATHVYLPRVEAGSNTSTVAVRVVRGDEKGSLEYDTGKYDCASEDQQQL
jgi:hypothetical protein